MPNALSGGEMQRVGIGRAMVRKPRMFLMDEPLSDLDAKLREELRVELRQIQQELKTTTLYVTHDQIEAMSMADRVAVLNEGIVHQVGVPKEVYDKPADLFVAGFIGIPKMNLFSCSVQGGAGGSGSVLSLESGAIKLPFGGNGGGAASKKIQKLPKWENLVLGVRPEAVRIHTDKSAGVFHADVLFLEHFGSMNIVNLKVGDKIFKSRTPATFRVEPNVKVGISFDEDKMILFDAETGKAMN
jgi:multiple sugar transport system ATP-binding protein